MRLAFGNEPPTIDKPCWHMKRGLQSVADSRAGWLTRLYVLAHTAHCGPCRRILEQLEAMIETLHDASEADPSHEAVERMMDKMNQ